MRIILDPQIFNDQKYGGISRYYKEIFSRLAQREVINIPLFQTSNVYLKESDLLTPKQKRNCLMVDIMLKLGISTRSMIRKNQTKIFNSTIINWDYDVFVPTYYDDYFLDKIKDKPFVLTVYDMIHELFPENFQDNNYSVSANKKKLMEKATRIIAVSNNTKKDILKIYPHIDASKIDVIYHGVSMKINSEIKIALPENYILFVGNRANYKNFKFFVTALKDTLLNQPNLVIVCAGGGAFSNDEKDFFNQLGISDKIIQKGFKEEELGLFYQKAKCFVFPSIYEGFGIPVLESMACGCPIVLGNHSSFPEVASDAGFYFDLNNPEDLKNKVELLLSDASLRDEYIQKGLAQVSKFNWDNAAQQCLEVYKKALK